MTENLNIETHPDWYKDVTPMRSLILGSFPPHESRWAYQFFYPNRRNRFWRILADLAGEPLRSTKENNDNAVDERYNIMTKLQVGVQNLGLEINRKGKSALDTDIEIVKFQDILSIIERHPELTRILLPGFAAPNSTAKSFIRYLQDKGIMISPIDQIKPETSFSFSFNGQPLQCVVLNSTSPASKVSYDLLLAQFGRYLKNSE